MKVKACAKINLCLDVLSRRPNGYHDVEMVMTNIDIADVLEIRELEEKKISLICNNKDLATDETNLIYKAIVLLQKETKRDFGVEVRLEKNIPMEAGMAGGSADAAAALRGMNKLYALGLSDAELCVLGAQIGSDIPFSLMGGTVLATGRGEIMQRLADFPATHVVLATPPVAVSTPWAYRSYDANPPAEHPNNAAFLDALARGDRTRCAGLICNVLEPVTEAEHPVIGDYRARMHAHGALCAMMSGSGPTVFGLFAEEQTAAAAAAAFRQETDAAVHLTRTAGRYEERDRGN